MVRLGLLPTVPLSHGCAYTHFPPVSGYFLKPKALHSQIIRQLSITAVRWQKQLPGDQKPDAQNPSRADTLENIKPEAVQKPSNASSLTEPRPDVLLSEQNISNKEQRKADWAIMKEMSRYLWPKVYMRETSPYRRYLTACIE